MQAIKFGQPPRRTEAAAGLALEWGVHAGTNPCSHAQQEAAASRVHALADRDHLRYEYTAAAMMKSRPAPARTHI